MAAKSVLSGEKATPTTLIRHYEGYRSAPYWDGDAWRIGYGTDTVTTADGQVIKVKPGMTISRADAERDLARRTVQFQKVIIGQVSQGTWNGLAPNVQAGLTSVAYNYGSLPADVAAAVKTGNVEKIAAAVATHATDNGSLRQRRRLEEAAIIAGKDGNIYSTMQTAPAWAKNLSANDRIALLNGADTAITRSDTQQGINEREMQRQQEAMQFDQLLQSTAMMPPTEIAKLQQTLQDATKSPVDYIQHEAQLRQFEKAVAQRNKQIAADPAGFVATHDQTTQEAFTAAVQGNDPAAIDHYVATVQGMQTHLGIPAQNQRILPQSVADQIVSQFSDQSQPQSGQNSAQMMQQLAQKWGPHWPQVFNELAGKIPATAMVIGNMHHADQRLAAERLAVLSESQEVRS